ncbi:methyltransferase [Frankia sp. AgB1.9]|uniref:methyltransferase n=1 Tax=unclassified Frankia TaxID=2632575 RepID=UPI001933A88F|nr:MULTISPECIES: methyltransferase [unclassified Frankia]MBL7494228.1 methyltransferase [Frankia sp. AgW1.1]MBL7552465.1 methyltransferase [Frankia sp. AgB1.9]MBL7623567.1 methyltransferase [Frankia sp. AgB1.8]
MPFFDPIESGFYGSCLENLLADTRLGPVLTDGLVELGAGTGIPMVEALRRQESTVAVRGFELDECSQRVAAGVVEKSGLANYQVVHGDFFDGAHAGRERCAVANPPYLPAAGDAPELWGGVTGAEISRRVLSEGFEIVLLLVSSISDPVGLLAHARAAGYRVSDWMARPIVFGAYTRDSRVSHRVGELARAGHAFFTPETYVIAGVTWVADPAGPDDIEALTQVLTAGHAASIGTAVAA